MSAGTKRSNADEDNADEANTVTDGGPGLAYMPFVVMEDLLDKLKLLNYEEVSTDAHNEVCLEHFTTI